MIILMSYLNARVGINNPSFINVIGKFGENYEANGNNNTLLEFCRILTG